MRRTRAAIAALALIIAVMQVGVMPASALARTKSRATITASSASSKIYHTITLTGLLRSISGRAIARTGLRLESRPKSSSRWTLVSAKKTNARGRASWGVQSKDDYYYRVRFSGSSRYWGSSSARKLIPGHHYSLIFDDDFTGSEIDTSAWTLQMRWGDNTPGTIQRFTTGAAAVQDGALVITADRSVNDTEFPYTSGTLSAHGANQYHFRYGYVETRAKIPRGLGLWPAVWLLGADPSDTSEIDVLEARGQLPYTNLMTVHFHGDQAGWHYDGDDLTAKYHTFAIDWSPTHIAWYRDGIMRAQTTDPRKISTDVMYLIANLQLGGWGGTPDATTPFPAKFYVDYIRVYQHQ